MQVQDCIRSLIKWIFFLPFIKLAWSKQRYRARLLICLMLKCTTVVTRYDPNLVFWCNKINYAIEDPASKCYRSKLFWNCWNRATLGTVFCYTWLRKQRVQSKSLEPALPCTKNLEQVYFDFVSKFAGIWTSQTCLQYQVVSKKSALPKQILIQVSLQMNRIWNNEDNQTNQAINMTGSDFTYINIKSTPLVAKMFNSVNGYITRC